MSDVRGYREDVERQLAEVAAKIAAARRRLADKELSDRVAAKGELAELETRHAQLRARLEAMKKQPPGEVEAWLRDESMLLNQQLQRWIEKY